MLTQLTIDISPAGDVKINVDGVQGKECLKATEKIEAALGRMTTRETKPAYHQHAAGQGNLAKNTTGGALG